MYTPLGKGGLGLSVGPLEVLIRPTLKDAKYQTSAIGSFLSLYGFLSVTSQLGFYPTLQRRFGTVNCLRGAMPGYFIVAAAAPAITALAQRGASTNVIYGLIASLVVIKAAANTAFASTSILVNAS